jgi:hypothetical protein
MNFNNLKNCPICNNLLKENHYFNVFLEKECSLNNNHILKFISYNFKPDRDVDSISLVFDIFSNLEAEWNLSLKTFGITDRKKNIYNTALGYNSTVTTSNCYNTVLGCSSTYYINTATGGATGATGATGNTRSTATATATATTTSTSTITTAVNNGATGATGNYKNNIDIKLPFFEPDFSDYNKLVNKIKTYMNFS